MAQTYFLKKLAEQKTRTVDAMFRLQPGDSHGHALQKGRFEAFEIAEKLYRESIKADDEELVS